jgi:FkbM family methyltransferase
MIKRILSKLMNLSPDERLKNACRRFYFKYFERPGPPFHPHRKHSYLEYKFKGGITVKSYYDIRDLIEIPVQGYIAECKMSKGDVVVDCGAHFGAFTLYAAKVVGDKGKVIAFEPDSVNFEKLERNINLNCLTNVIAIKKGVYSKNTSLAFDSSHDEGAHVLSDGQADPNTCVSVVTLDSELELLGIQRVDFIKMDVEGAEIEAIKGAVRILASNDVHLAIASYHEVDGKPTSSELEKLLTSQNYKTETTFPSHITTYAFKNPRNTA